MLKIVIGCDDAGYEMKESIKEYLCSMGFEVEDLGVDKDGTVEYPVTGERVACAVTQGRFDRGILICGTGIGMSIVANKIPGIRAALCHDTYSAERARKSNDAQILTMGARVIGIELAKKVVDAWLSCDFAGGRSTNKLAKLVEIDECYRK